MTEPPAHWQPKRDPRLVRMLDRVMPKEDADRLSAYVDTLPWYRRFWFWLSGGKTPRRYT